MAGLLFGNLVAAPQRQRRARTYRENDNWLSFTDEELRARYRFGREYIEYILNVIGKDLRRNHAMSPSKQLLVALRFFASGSFLQVVGDIEGVDKSSASRAVQHVSQLLAAKREMFIKWPTSASRGERQQKRILPQATLSGRDWMCGRDPQSHHCTARQRSRLCESERVSFHKCSSGLQS